MASHPSKGEIRMKRIITALLAAVLCVAVHSTASAEKFPVIVTKLAKWGVYGPTGVTGTLSDTTHFNGAMSDTTAPIYIGDMAFFNPAGGTVSTTENNILKVTIIGNGVADNVDSVYYRIESSVDGNHFTSVLAAEHNNNQIGAIAGIDQGNGTAGTTVNNQLQFFVTIDPDQVSDGASGTAAIFNNSWWMSPYIRIFIRTLASDDFKAASLYVSYPGYRESH